MMTFAHCLKCYYILPKHNTCPIRGTEVYQYSIPYILHINLNKHQKPIFWQWGKWPQTDRHLPPGPITGKF
jgi:hypothetical protein